MIRAFVVKSKKYIKEFGEGAKRKYFVTKDKNNNYTFEGNAGDRIFVEVRGRIDIMTRA